MLDLVQNQSIGAIKNAFISTTDQSKNSALIAVPGANIFKDPYEEFQSMDPHYEIVDIDYSKVKYDFVKNSLCELHQFYEDGILIRVPNKKVEYVDIDFMNVMSKIVAQKKENDKDRAIKGNDSDLSYHFAKNFLAVGVYSAKGFQKKVIYTSPFKKFTDPEFKDNIYVIIDSYSKTKAFKFSLKIFDLYEDVKKILCRGVYDQDNFNQTDEDYPEGFERHYFEKLLKIKGLYLFHYNENNKNIFLQNHFFEKLDEVIHKLTEMPLIFYRTNEDYREVADLFIEAEKNNQSMTDEDTKKYKDKIAEIVSEFFGFVSESQENTIEIDHPSNVKDPKAYVELVRLIMINFFNLKTQNNPNKRKGIIFSLAQEMSKHLNFEQMQFYENFLATSFYRNKFEDRSTIGNFYTFFSLFIQFTLMAFYTQFGRYLPNGKKIDVESMTSIDARCYWPGMHPFLLMKDFLEPHQAPIIFKDEKIQNEVEMNGADERSFLANRFNVGISSFYRGPEIDKEIRKEIKTITEEALKNSHYNIPYKACIELDQDPYFKFIKFIEEDDVVYIFILDHDERFLFEVFDKQHNFFRNYIFDQNMITHNSFEFLSKMRKDFHRFISIAIRDFKVSINRDKVLGPVRHRVPTGVRTQQRRIIYLPRIKYNYINKDSREALKNEMKSIRSGGSGFRNGHVRRLQDGHKASPLQITLARRQELDVPNGYTYVRSCLFGQKTMSEQEVIYRSRHLSSRIFISYKMEDDAENIVKMSPAGFEEYCKKIIGKLGWIPSKDRVVDGGIDIEAFKSTKDEKVIRLFAQCKHWRKNVGPDVVRELLGSQVNEDKQYETELMIITSGKFSSGALDLAKKHNIHLINGNDLLNVE